jgi:beta-glucanase (GH16 family)
VRVRLPLLAACASVLATAFLSIALGPGGAGAATSAAPSCGAAIARPGGGNWTCTFDDEFTGSTLDAKNWTVLTSAAGVPTVKACFANSTSNVAVGGGVLALTARGSLLPRACKTSAGTRYLQYTAGEVASTGKFAQTYGRFAIRAKFPATATAGLQSALWLWPQAYTYGSASGEIDVAESYSKYSDRAIPYLHYAYSTATTNLATATNLVTNNNCLITKNAFHEYVATWTASTITIQIDGRTCLADRWRAAAPLTGNAPFNRPFFLALTQGLGTGANGPSLFTPLPATTQVDWVRVWK